ncbi:uncharacterized protein LOC117640878 [Thrips palmi]|uniref:Uncharacterized protein LOC117640878 n=1 Tax=Thrips palmi TaxID=161013 RepID=A0A6P8YBS3_THRPL|nr:uncharacterized protein LOC117640878 [Thrips palmi]
MQLQVGARYPSFKALEAAIERFSLDTNSVYTVYNSRLVEKENLKRPADKQLPLCLKYKHIKFACKHYGMRKSKSRGLRPNQSTFKIGCPSYIYVAAHSEELVVEKMEIEHTHSCDPELVAMYPERRSLSHLGNDDGEEEETSENATLKMVREDVLDLLLLGIDRRRIRNYVRICTGRVMLTGDLANLAKYIRQNPRHLSTARAEQLLEHVKVVESKENVPTSRPLTTREKFNSMKRRVALPSELGGDDMRDEDGEHCYSAGPSSKQKRMRVESNKRQSDNPLHLEHTEHQEEYPEQHQSQEEQHTTATWDPNSSLADVVKSILGPNQEGPVIVHVNNYEGVAVVEVEEGQKYVTGDEVDPDSLLLQKQQNDPEPGVRAQNQVKRTARKSLSPRKPVIVSNKAIASNENIPTSKVVINTMDAPSKNPAVQIVPERKTEIIINNPDNDYADEEDNNFNSPNMGEENDSVCDQDQEEASVLREERTMYRVKTQKLKLQIRHLKNDLDKHEFEKEKLQLEIRLLELNVAAKERQKKMNL